MKNPDNDKETRAIEVFKSLAIAGKPGKYISIENGPNAVSEPNRRIRKKCFFFVIEGDCEENFAIDIIQHPSD